MGDQPAGGQPPKSKKRISIRKHLPLPIRVHYDIVRNWSPIKLAGLAAMSLVATLGVLLATQAFSPQSSAARATITLKQLNDNFVEADIALSEYPLANVVYVVTDVADCNQATIGGTNWGLTDLDERLDMIYLINDQYEHSRDSEYKYYQADESDEWKVLLYHDWIASGFDKSGFDNFKFRFPVLGGTEFGYVGDRNTQAVYEPGKYLCVQLGYHDNNQSFKDYKRIDLLTIYGPEKDGASYEFTSNRSVYWSAVKAGNILDFETCEADISTSGQMSTSFTFEATADNQYGHFCIVARDSSGLQAYKLIMSSLPKEEQEDGDDDESDDTGDNTQQNNNGNTGNNNQGSNNNGNTGTNNQGSNNNGNTGNTGQTGGQESTLATISVDDFITTNGYDSNQKDLILEKDDELMGENIWEYDETETTHYATTEDADAYHLLLQAYLDDQEEDDNDQSGTVINSVDANSGGTGNTVESTSLNAADAQGSIGDTTTVPDTGILDDQNMAQLIGYILVAAAILGAVRVLMVKKYKKVGNR